VTRIVVEINIHRPIGVVFDYITTPANWPVWHPASRAVRGAVDHSLLIGEQVTEEFVAGGRQGSCVWQVYPVHVSTRKSFGLMTRKLSVTESRKLLQFLGTLSRKKSSVTSANCPHVA